jgi:hypothetical protein
MGKRLAVHEREFTKRDERRALNEATFRNVNERIRSVNESFAFVTSNFSIVCECDDETCVEQIVVAAESYEEVRADPTLFFVRPGHEAPKVETVDAKTERYLIVRKREGPPAEIARATDPRD